MNLGRNGNRFWSSQQQAEARRLDKAIAANLALIGYPLIQEVRDDR